MPMKNTIKKALFALSLIVVFYSCSKDENNPDEEITVADMAKIKAAMTTGEWIVTYYFDSGVDDTNDYVGYSFTFQADGNLGATDGNTALSGAWSMTTSDNGTDDTVDDEIEFEIFFTSPDIFAELSDDWDILKFTSGKIELMDLSDDNSTTDYLTFEKK